MSSTLAYIVYQAMTSGLNNVSFYAVDTSNNQHNFNVLVPSTNTYYYYDNSDASYTATSFKITVNNLDIIAIPLNKVQKTANTILIVVITLDVTINLPGELGVVVTQAVQGLFAGALLNLGCSITAYYTITNKSNNQQNSGSVGLSFNLVNNSEFTASGSISYCQYAVVSITQITISCSSVNVEENIPIGTLNSDECTNSSGCKFTITITFTS